MNQALVSVITPSYQQGKFIKATIDSVLTQDYPNIELIVIDGGSTDETLDVLRHYDDPRMTWISEKDEGQTDAINKGIRRAKGDILTYLNSDDVLFPGCIRFIVDTFTSYPDVSVVFGDTSLIDAAGKVIGDAHARPYTAVSVMTGGNANPQQGTFWRRQVTEQIGLFDTSLHYCMDYEYWLRMSLAGYEIRYVPGYRAGFRMHGESKTMTRYMAFERDMRQIFDDIYARADVPAEIRAAHDSAYAFLDWWRVKGYYADRDYEKARPLLKTFMRSRRRGRKILAWLMWIDTMLHTRMARFASNLHARWRGSTLLPE